MDICSKSPFHKILMDVWITLIVSQLFGAICQQTMGFADVDTSVHHSSVLVDLPDWITVETLLDFFDEGGVFGCNITLNLVQRMALVVFSSSEDKDFALAESAGQEVWSSENPRNVYRITYSSESTLVSSFASAFSEENR